MRHSIEIARLKNMSPDQRSRQIRELVKSTERVPNGEMKTISDELAKYESKFGFASDQLNEKLRRGEIHEDADVCQWLMIITLRDRLGAVTPRTR